MRRVYVPCVINHWTLYDWVIRWHETGMLFFAEHWHVRRVLSNYGCAYSVISMWHGICLQHHARACSDQPRTTSALPINHVIQMPQCLSGFVNHDYWHDAPPLPQAGNPQHRRSRGHLQIKVNWIHIRTHCPQWQNWESTNRTFNRCQRYSDCRQYIETTVIFTMIQW